MIVGGRKNGETFNIFNSLPVSAIMTMKAAGWKFKFDGALIVGACSPMGWKWGY